MMRNILLSLCLSLMNGIPVFCQDNPWREIFDDGGISNARQALKMDITNFFQGEYLLTYENYVSDNISLEAGAGYLQKNFNYGLYYLIDQETYAKGLTFSNTGWSAMFSPKLCFGSPSSGMYSGLSFRYRKFTEIETVDASFVMGKQYLVLQHLSLDLGIHLGIRYQKSLDGLTNIFADDLYEDLIPIFFAIHLRTGYLF